jgi:hypothetical protein
VQAGPLAGALATRLGLGEDVRAGTGVSLGIGPKTVINHVEHAYSKRAVSNRVGATMYAMQYGIGGCRPHANEMASGRELP